MTNLATTADLEARLGRSLTGTETTRAAAYLADASGLIRGYTRQTFTAVTADVVTLRPIGMTLRLPQRPVSDVTSVVAVGWAGLADVTLPEGAWGWDGLDMITLGPFSSRLWLTFPDVEIYGYPDTYTVTYNHGYASVPADVVAVCCGMVLRVLLSPSQVEGMSSEHIGEYSYQLSQQIGGGSPGVTARLSEMDKDALSRYRVRATTVQMRL